MRGAGLGEGRVDLLVGGHVAPAEHPADVDRHRLALGVVHIEDGDLDALGGQRAYGRLAEAGSAAGDHRGDGRIEFHEAAFPVFIAAEVRFQGALSGFSRWRPQPKASPGVNTAAGARPEAGAFRKWNDGPPRPGWAW